MGFEDFIGQERAVNIIKEGLRSGRLNHAYLFYGPEDRGKYAFSLATAKGLSCFQEGEDFCGTCLSCQKIDRGVYPDLRVILPQKNTIKMEEIKKIRAFSSWGPHEGPRKIVLIKEAQLMTLPAANSLLKLLEEPPSYLYFLLISSSPDLMVQTIISRCQPIPLDRVSRGEIYSFIRKESSLPEEELKTVAHLADGSVGQALRILSSPDWKERRERYMERVRHLIWGGEEEIFKQAEDLAGEEDITGFMEFLEGFARDCLVYQARGGRELIINVDFMEDISRGAEENPRKWLRIIKEVEVFKKNFHIPLNKRLSLEALLVKMKG